MATSLKTCSISDCSEDVHSRGWCSVHYIRWWKFGDPLGRAVPMVEDPMVCRCCNTPRPLANFPTVKTSGSRTATRRTCTRCRSVSRYGLTAATYEAMLVEQGYRCAICPASPGSEEVFHVDHDHACCPGPRSCGACIRGLLCSRCNLGLGCFRDDPDRLLRAASYVVR